jgi:hypothetical protein
MEEELNRELQRLYARAVERAYTVSQVKKELSSLGIEIETTNPAGIMDDIRRLIAIQARNKK